MATEKVSKPQILAATRTWLGCYEGTCGLTVETMVEEGMSDADIIASNVPADMLAAFHHAKKAQQDYADESCAQTLARRAAARHPGHMAAEYIQSARSLVRSANAAEQEEER